METNLIIRNGELFVVMVAVILAIVGGVAQLSPSVARTSVSTIAR